MCEKWVSQIRPDRFPLRGKKERVKENPPKIKSNHSHVGLSYTKKVGGEGRRGWEGNSVKKGERELEIYTIVFLFFSWPNFD